jgi:hypothetical protein
MSTITASIDGYFGVTTHRVETEGVSAVGLAKEGSPCYERVCAYV